MKKHDFAVAISAYNRPIYFHSLIKRLKSQVVDIPVHLYVDGVPDYSKYLTKDNLVMSSFVTNKLQEAIIGIFKDNIPNGIVHVSPNHLGVQLNSYRRLSTFDFAKKCLFLDDDLWLSNNYINIIKELFEFSSSYERIGMVSGFGDLRANWQEQKDNSGKLKRMEHQLGWACSDEVWKEVNEVLDGYIECEKIRNETRSESIFIGKLKDYNDKNGFWGKRIGNSYGIDEAIYFALTSVGKIAIAPTQNFLIHIGLLGANSDNPNSFINKNFWTQMELFEDDIGEFYWSQEDIDSILKNNKLEVFGDGEQKILSHSNIMTLKNYL